jgi:DNA-binding NarL/FixJ family response regulator
MVEITMITVQIIGGEPLHVALNDEQLVVIGQHTVVNEGWSFTGLYKPDIILLDYNLVKSDVLIIVSLLLLASPQSRLILVVEDLNDELLIDCLVNGAYGYLAVNALEVFLVKAVKAVHSGEAWISRKTAALLIARLRG